MLYTFRPVREEAANMYEITQKGAWFNWSALNAAEKRLAALSIAAAVPPGLVVGFAAGEKAYRAGYRLASGAAPPAPSHFAELAAELLPPAAVLAALLCAVVSAFAWWRFSLRQDELFNRIQNRALGHSAGWGVGAAAGWWFLERAGLVGPLPLGWLLVFVLALLYYFWFSGVRRWA